MAAPAARSVADILQQGNLLGSAHFAFDATAQASDTVDLNREARALWVGGAGAISLITSGGDQVLISGIPAGTLLPIAVSRLRATGTTATLIIGIL